MTHRTKSVQKRQRPEIFKWMADMLYPFQCQQITLFMFNDILLEHFRPKAIPTCKIFHN